MMPLDYPLWLRAAHFFNFLLLSLFDSERFPRDPELRTSETLLERSLYAW